MKCVFIPSFTDPIVVLVFSKCKNLTHVVSIHACDVWLEFEDKEAIPIRQNHTALFCACELYVNVCLAKACVLATKAQHLKHKWPNVDLKSNAIDVATVTNNMRRMDEKQNVIAFIKIIVIYARNTV